MSKILVVGAGGQLGQCLKKVAEKRSIDDISFPTEQEANILNIEQLQEIVVDKKPKYIINCAAYTAVDKAEDEIDISKAINEAGAANLAKVCQTNDIALIHISTDFVFNGSEVKLLSEGDDTKPVNVYGQTKLAGEKAVEEYLTSHFIIRTSWLYSEFANNFVKTMLKLGAERDELNVIADQVGTPTYAIDLAHAIYDIIELGSQEFGIYHYSNEGVTSWYDFAKAIFELGGINIKVNPIPGSAYPTRAKRPAFSVMDKTKIKSVFNIAIPYWRNSLEQCIKEISKSN